MDFFVDHSGLCVFITNDMSANLKKIAIENIYELIELHSMFDPMSLLGRYRFKVEDATGKVVPVAAEQFNTQKERELDIGFINNLSMAQIAHQSIDAYSYYVAKGWVKSLRLVVSHTIIHKEKYDLINMMFNDQSLLTIRINNIEKSVKTVASCQHSPTIKI